MKIIDILNKIANGEEIPKKIKYKDNIYYYFSNKVDLYKYETMPTEFQGSLSLIMNNMYLNLNDKVEIIEEDNKIEKLDEYIYCDSLNYNTCNMMFENIVNKINELIDEIEKLKENNK